MMNLSNFFTVQCIPPAGCQILRRQSARRYLPPIPDASPVSCGTWQARSESEEGNPRKTSLFSHPAREAPRRSPQSLSRLVPGRPAHTPAPDELPGTHKNCCPDGQSPFSHPDITRPLFLIFPGRQREFHTLCVP